MSWKLHSIILISIIPLFHGQTTPLNGRTVAPGVSATTRFNGGGGGGGITTNPPTQPRQPFSSQFPSQPNRATQPPGQTRSPFQPSTEIRANVPFTTEPPRAPGTGSTRFNNNGNQGSTDITTPFSRRSSQFQPSAPQSSRAGGQTPVAGQTTPFGGVQTNRVGGGPTQTLGGQTRAPGPGGQTRAPGGQTPAVTPTNIQPSATNNNLPGGRTVQPAGTVAPGGGGRTSPPVFRTTPFNSATKRVFGTPGIQGVFKPQIGGSTNVGSFARPGVISVLSFFIAIIIIR